MLQEYEKAEQASDNPFPDLGYFPKLNGVSGPLFRETERRLLDLHRLIDTKCVKGLNKKNWTRERTICGDKSLYVLFLCFSLFVDLFKLYIVLSEIKVFEKISLSLHF